MEDIEDPRSQLSTRWVCKCLLLPWIYMASLQGAVSLKFRSSFLSPKYASLPPKSFSETAPRYSLIGKRWHMVQGMNDVLGHNFAL